MKRWSRMGAMTTLFTAGGKAVPYRQLRARVLNPRDPGFNLSTRLRLAHH
jgi:hypothetical protein